MPDAPENSDPPGAPGTDAAASAADASAATGADAAPQEPGSATPVFSPGATLAGVVVVTVLALLVDLLAIGVPNARLGALLVGGVAFAGAVASTATMRRRGEPIGLLLVLTVVATGLFAVAVAIAIGGWYSLSA